MRKYLMIILLALMLTGCSKENTNLNRMMTLRDSVQNCETCEFSTTITADYSEVTYTFKMNCQLDSTGKMSFEVTYPETIAGITGELSDDRGGITFDGSILAFETLCNGQVTPVYTPWIMLKALRSGYIRSCTDDFQQCMIIIDDTYENNATEFRFIMDTNFAPQSAEIICCGRRVALLEVSNFVCM